MQPIAIENEEVKACFGNKEGSTTVSYTHLDVYKRQVRNTFADVGFVFFICDRAGNGTCHRKIVRSIIPVFNSAPKKKITTPLGVVITKNT